MIKGLLRGTDGRAIVLLGLSNENVERLFKNKPIHIDLAAPRPAGLDLDGAPIVTIIAGETERGMIDDLSAQLGSSLEVIESFDTPGEDRP
jgi:hypothetical protein